MKVSLRLNFEIGEKNFLVFFGQKRSELFWMSQDGHASGDFIFAKFCGESEKIGLNSAICRNWTIYYIFGSRIGLFLAPFTLRKSIFLSKIDFTEFF